jgi:PAS domain S-box-containing protein
MSDTGYIPDTNPLRNLAPILIIATTIACIFLTVYCLYEDINIIYPHLFYIPILLTSLFYPKKGTAYAILLSMIFLFATFVISESNQGLLFENLIRVIVFVGIAAITSRISILLKEDNLKYKNLMDSSGAASAVLDNKGKIVHINHDFERITGRSLRELKRMGWTSIFDNQYREIASMLYHNSVKGGSKGGYKDDLVVVSRTGEEYFVLATIRHIPELSITLISLVDITEKKKIEKMIAVQKERYKKLFQQSIDGIFIHSTEGRIYNANAEALRIAGMNLEEIKNCNLKNVVSEKFHNEFYRALTEDLEEGNVFNSEIRIQSPIGEHIDLDLRSVMVDKDTKVIQTITRDITQRKNSEKSLEIALKKLNLLSSITSHDIRNHIMVAKMNLEFAKEDISDNSVRTFLNKSALAIDTIQHQIEFSRDYQEMGGKPPRWHKLEKVIGFCIESQNLPQKIQVESHAEDVEIFADPMFEKVICNLIGNTTMHGKNVNRISIYVKKQNESFNLIYEDNGTGIPEKDKRTIFKPGFGKNQGFGLYLVSEILSITGATIKETGTEGSGARFEISFPKTDLRFDHHKSDG